MSRQFVNFFIIFLQAFLMMACGKSFTVKQEFLTPPVASESEFCAVSTSYSPGVVASGTAKFLRRGLNIQLTSGVVTSATTGAVISTALPIKYAEIKVLQNGNIIQCGTTNSIGELRAIDGASPLLLPNDPGSFTIEVYSRSNFTFPSVGKPSSSTLSTAVKEDIYSNSVYKISGTYTSSGFGGSANTPLNLVAQASEFVSSKIEGGAFNIYNDYVTAFEYLTSSSNTGSLSVNCLNERLDMYWKAGFNPYTYIDSNSSTTLSFYLRDDNELYICGGQENNVSTADTDHWDDAVILHEIGHHIENVCGRMDSPGGTHYAQYRIDPRLAWSEGWGNFMGAHIIRNNTEKINPNLVSGLPNGEWLFYHDTIGYIDGTTPTTNQQLILMRLNKSGGGAGPGSSHDIVSPASYPGESHFREASIARGLFKGVNTCTDHCGGGVSFDKYWTALGSTIDGMSYFNSPFSSSDKFFAKVFSANSNTFTTSMTTIMTNDEALHMTGSASFTVTATSSSTGSISTNAWSGFGKKLSTATACDQNLLQPRAPNATNGRTSDQRYSNHFFAFSKVDLAGVTQIRLVPDSSCNVDLDLIVLNPNYNYPEEYCTHTDGLGLCDANSKYSSIDSDIAGLSRNPANSEEQVTISGLTSSYYLLNVRGFSTAPQTIPSNSACIYKLTDQNGSTLCPSTSY